MSVYNYPECLLSPDLLHFPSLSRALCQTGWLILKVLLQQGCPWPESRIYKVALSVLIGMLLVSNQAAVTQSYLFLWKEKEGESAKGLHLIKFKNRAIYQFESHTSDTWSIIKGQIKQFLSQLELFGLLNHPLHGSRRSARQLIGANYVIKANEVL